MAFLPFCFRDYSGLAVCPFSPKAFFPAAGGGAQSIRPSIIEARSASRRETVKICHVRLRKKLNGTSERPRLAVFRSNKHLYAQVIDDTKGCTLASASSIHKSLREELETSSGTTIEVAKRLGSEIAKACLAKGITKVAFDRGGFVYHGRIEALANAARENGLVF